MKDALFHVFPQIPNESGDFEQGCYAPLPQFIPPGLLPGIHYIPPPLALNVVAETSKEVHGKEVLRWALGDPAFGPVSVPSHRGGSLKRPWFQLVYRGTQILVMETGLRSWSPGQTVSLYSCGKGWLSGCSFTCLGFPSDKHLNLTQDVEGPKPETYSRVKIFF